MRLIDHEGRNAGIVPVSRALEMRMEYGLDLVEISPGADPPVCKLMDLGKFKYEEQKKASESRKRQKTIEIKEIKLRPGIAAHDYEVKMRAISGFVDDGDRVKIVMRFRGREMSHQEIGLERLRRIVADMGDRIRVEQEPRAEGRQIIMLIAPK